MLDLASKLDSWLYRHPFEGDSAHRYARHQRPGFLDLDDRLIASWRDQLDAAHRVLDVGAGPGTFAARLGAAHPHLTIIEIEPSQVFARSHQEPRAEPGIEPGAAPSVKPGIRPATRRPGLIQARAEALPLLDDSIDLAICLSSIRHVGDREAALRELRRVVRPTGCVYIVELDPAASWRRIRRHGRAMRSLWARLAFGPLVVKTAPRAESIANAARRAGWSTTSTCDDPLQPVYIMRLSP